MLQTVDQRAALLVRLTSGDKSALAELFSQHGKRLCRMVRFRMDPRLCGRVDADDVLQESYLDAADRIEHIQDMQCGSPYVWLRAIVGQTLANVHRRHLGVKARDVGREVSIHALRCPPATSISLACLLIGNLTSPSRAAIRAELATLLETAVESMDEIDREVLMLRHFEELTNSETAEVLGIQEKAASIRYVRAIRRLKRILSQLSCFDVNHD